MSLNGSGTFNLPTGNPVVSGTTISSTVHNSTMNEIATALSTAIFKDGQQTITANIPFNGNKITGLGAATVGGDAVRQDQVNIVDPPDATDSGTDVFEVDLGYGLATGETFVLDVGSANTTATPTLENTGGAPSGAQSIVDVDGNARDGLLAARPHRFLWDGTNYVVLDPERPRERDFEIKTAGSIDFRSVNTTSSTEARLGTTTGGAVIEEPNAGNDIRHRVNGNDLLTLSESDAQFPIDVYIPFNQLLTGKTSTGLATPGAEIKSSGVVNATVNGSTVLNVNRRVDDGRLVGFYQDTSLEGAIDVSGTTVSYNGAHLARWSQLPNNQRKNIPRGTVMTLVDEMCHWPDEDNEQLTRSQVSDTPGDRNIAGVFDRWDDDEVIDGEGNPIHEDIEDFYLANTGDFIIRVTGKVEVGDLLESAGDGTARAQGDQDFVKRSTVARATRSFNGDGETLLPCLLMVS